MGATLETSAANGQSLDHLTDETAGTAVTISRTGAEIVSLRKRDGSGNWHGFMHRDGETDAPAGGWPHHATVMGYYLHRLWHEQSNYRGFEIHGGNHGFVRHFAFDEPAFDPEGGLLTYTVSADRIPPEAYPLKVRLDLTYGLAGGRLSVTFRFTNQEPNLDAHVSFGLHPGFEVSSIDAARILLPAGTYERHMAPGNFLNGEIERIEFNGGPMPFDKSALPDSYLLGIGNAGDRVFRLEDPPSGRTVELDLHEAPYLTLWSNLDPFVCIEPCWGLPDSNPPTPFEQKTGIQRILPGKTLERTFAIRPGFLE